MASHVLEAEMTRPSLTRIHLTAAIAAVALITIFLAASAAAELAGSAPAVRLLRHAVLAGLIPLVASLVLTALTGRRLAGGRRSTALRRKQRRLQAAATVGLLILIPCALILNQLAA